MQQTAEAEAEREEAAERGGFGCVSGDEKKSGESSVIGSRATAQKSVKSLIDGHGPD